MSDTQRFNMPLLDAAQAQKHVTVNEALLRADALAAARVESRNLSAPPVSPLDGTAYVVGAGATNEWNGQDGNIAVSLNNGWEFITPWDGLRMWDFESATEVRYLDGAWISNAISVTSNQAFTTSHTIEFDHALASSATSTTIAIIPDKAIVLGVSGRVIQEITGANSWSLGVTGSPDRYGSGYGLSVGSFAHGVTSQPQTYFGATSLEITSDGPSFTAGSIRLAVHYLAISPPRPV